MTAVNEPRVAVVVSTYQRADRLRGLVSSLERQSLTTDQYEVVIVDNGSTDDTSRVLERLVSESKMNLRTLRIEGNHGPVPARNLGWRSTTTPWVAFTDDDCQPAAEWLEAGLRAASTEPGTGLVQGRTLPATTPIPVWSATRRVECFSGLFEGCNLLVRRDALDASGGFDERFHFYGEETSMGWSIIEHGFGTAFASDAVVYHDVTHPPFRHRLRERAMEGNLVTVARLHPGFRAEVCWQPWAFRRENAIHLLAVLSLVGAIRDRRALVGTMPWLLTRWPDSISTAAAVHVSKRWVEDSVGLWSMLRSSLRERTLLL